VSRQSAPSPKKLKVIREALLTWGRHHRRDFPWRKTRDKFKVLLAEVLLHQTNVQKVLPAFGEIVEKWPTPARLSEASQTELSEIVRPLGFGYRAKVLKALAQKLVAEHGGKVPAVKDQLLQLPGVGEYTASAVLTFTTRQIHPMLDAPISRTLARIFGYPAVAPDAHPSAPLRNVARLLVLPGKPLQVNLALIDLSAELCTVVRPRCSQCPLTKWCNFYKSVDKSEIR